MFVALGKWIVRLFGGFNIFGGEEPGARLGKIIYSSIICIVIIFLFWHFILAKRISNTETYTNSNVTQNRDCSDKVLETVKEINKENKKARPWFEIRVWKIINIGVGGI